MNSKSQYRRNIFTDCLTKLECDTRQKYDQYHIKDNDILNWVFFFATMLLQMCYKGKAFILVYLVCFQ